MTSRTLLDALLLVLVCGCGSDEHARPIGDTSTGSRGVATQLPDSPKGQLTGSDCPIEIPAGQTVSCGKLTVPLDYAQANGAKIELAVLVFKGKGEGTPALYLEGGPGGAGSLSWESLFSYFEPLLQGRDVVVLDQRGTGHSSPLLDCPNLDEDLVNTLPTADQVPTLAGQLGDCAATFAGNGVNPAAFNTHASARDVEELRKALGYDQWNVIGVSYGTRLALDVMRYFPAGVASVVLDSVFPPDVDVETSTWPNVAAAFSRIFEHCAADPECAAAYPDQETTFYDTVVALNQEPVELTLSGGATLQFDGLQALSLFGNLAYDVDGIEIFPELVRQMVDGDFHNITKVVNQLSAEPAGVPRIAIGLYLSVICSEYTAFSSVEAVQAAYDTLNPKLGGLLSADDSFTLCAGWGVPAADAAEREAVVSDIPTLILSGAYDPVTPRAWAESTQQSLPNAWLVGIEGAGHAVLSTACGPTLINAFWNNPNKNPSTLCPTRNEDLSFIVVPQSPATASIHFASLPQIRRGGF